ncbi:MAG: DNA polymerase III subunit delta [Deltaproteobacteria bacterium]|jgi:DNA polymerase-3 subunit delta|nr:DNA polymerase III subunit delta [Deltaproteobacteria bacterium]
MAGLADIRQMLKEGSVPSLLMLYGDESYFVGEATNMIVDALVAVEDRDFNLTVYHGRDLNPVDITEQAATMPVFASRRLVLIKDLHDAPPDKLDTLIPYLEDPVPETVLLMTAAKIDGRRRFFQVLKQSGRVFEFKKIYDNQLPAVVRDMASDKGVSFASGALKLFCKRVGSSLMEVQGELTKLLCFLGERDLIEEEDVLAVVSDTRVESVFQLTDALGQGETDAAMRLLDRLLAEGQAPLMVLAMICRHFRQLWKTASLDKQGVPQKEMVRQVGISPYFIKGLVAQARRYDDHDFRAAFELFLATDMAIKSSGAAPHLHLDMLVLNLAALGTNRGK